MRETPAIDKIVKVTGIPEHRVYETLRTVRQFERYAEDEANESATYDAGFAAGMRDSLKIGGGINNWDISQAIKELTS